MRVLLLILLFIVSIAVGAQPVASFDADRYKVCHGNDVALTNTSIGATSYEWYVDNVFYSTDQHVTATLYEPVYGLQAIQLVARDAASGLTDTFTRVVEVMGSAALHLNADPLNCVGDTVRLKVNASALSQHWSIMPQQQLIYGCDTCDSLAFVIHQLGITVDLHSVYQGGCSQNVTYHYFNCNPIGTDVNDPTRGTLNLYPNPATDRIIIEHSAGDEIKRVGIYNGMGSLCREFTGADLRVLDVSRLAGTYFLKVELTKETAVERVVLLGY